MAGMFRSHCPLDEVPESSAALRYLLRNLSKVLSVVLLN